MNNSNKSKFIYKSLSYGCVPLRVLPRSKTETIRRLNILPEIPRPNPWEKWGIVTISSNVVRGGSVNHLVAHKFSSRTNNVAAVYRYIAALQPIMMDYRGCTFAGPYFVVNP